MFSCFRARSKKLSRHLPLRRSSLQSLRIEQLEHRRLLSAVPQNVILMIGDGMGFEQVEAGSYLLGGELSFESFLQQAEMTTNSADNAVTDSAASGTAMATGTKVNNGVISMAYPGDGSELTTSLEIHRDAGKMTGLVSTAFITHATPAVFGAHEPSRTNYNAIGADYLYTKPNVLLGGGANGMDVSSASAAGYTVVTTADELSALDTENTTYVSGQFGDTHMPYELDGLGDLPDLSAMTTSALAVLDNDPDGFFLMVEGARIDHAGHENNLLNLQAETVEFSNAVQEVIDWVGVNSSWEETLVIVTADHETGGLTFDSETGEYTWSTTGHTDAHVPIYARGAGSENIAGILDNTDIFALTTNLQSTSFQQNVGGYQATADTNLFENTPLAQYGSAVSLTVDANEPAETDHDAQALLRFDGIFGDDTAQVPLDAAITSAYVQLHVTNPGNSIAFHRMLQDWSETDTWESRGTGVQTDDVEATATPDASTTEGLSGSISIPVTASLQAWQADPTSNYGWAMLPTSSDGTDFDSSEGAVPPKLIVMYRVTDPNARPIAADDGYVMQEDGNLAVDGASGVLINDTDDDGDPLSAVLVDDASHGALALAEDGSFTYEPDPDFNGTDSFTYTANDGRVNGNTATVSITVTGVNDPPTVSAEIPDAVFDEDAVDQVMNLWDFFADVDILTYDDSLSFEIVDNLEPGVLSAGIVDHVLTLDSLKNAHGNTTLRIRATDSSGDWVEDEFSVTVNSVNDAPTVISPIPDITVDEGTVETVLDLSSVFGDVDAATDADVLTLSVSGNDNPDLVWTLIEGDVLKLAYAPDHSGEATITVRAMDSHEAWVDETLLVTVKPSAVEDRAISETTAAGFVSTGDLGATYGSDDVYEAISEEGYAGNRSRLEHTWQFDVTGGETVTFLVEAYHDSAVEQFVFDYSTETSGWVTMFEVTKTGDDNQYQSYSLPTGTAGTVLIRVTDTDRSKEPDLDTIFIDDMFIRCEGGGGLPAVGIEATDANASEDGTDTGMFTVSRTGATSGDLVVSYTIGGTAEAGVDYDDSALTGTVTILDGASEAIITIDPIDDGLAEGQETVILTLAIDPAYTIGASTADTVTISDNDVTAIDVYAASEEPVTGNVTGDLTSIRSNDGTYLELQESLILLGKGRSELEHRWTFDIVEGSNVTFYVEAHHNEDAVEDFAFEYSLDGEIWISMLAVTKTTDDDSYQTFELPATTSGTVYVRAVDTDRSNKETTQDTLFIDEMFFRVE